MGFGGLIASAIGGGAREYTEVAAGEVKKQNQIDLTNAIAEAQAERDLRIDEVKRARGITDIGRKAEADAAAAPTVARGQVAASKAKLEAEDAGGLPEAEGALAERRARGLQGVRDIAREDKAQTTKAEATAKAEADTEANNDPEYIAGLKAKARAQHIESAGSLAQAAAANLSIEEKKKLIKLQDEYPNATPERQAAIERQIALITGKDPDNSVPIFEADEMGNKVYIGGHDKKTNTFVPRKPGAATPPGNRSPLSFFNR